MAARRSTKKKIDLSIAVTSRGRAAIASRIAVSFYVHFGLPAGSRVTVAMGYGNADIGGLRTPIVVARKRFHFGFGNPAGLARMAFLGRGCYPKRLPLRAIGVFPSWDRLVFALRRDSGIRSIEEIRERRYPLCLSTRSGEKFHTTSYIVDEVLRRYGFSLRDIEGWGGKILRCPRPGGEERVRQLRSGEAEAVFDEGVKSWGNLALDCGMVFLPIRQDVLREMGRLGFPSAPITKANYPQLEDEIMTLDFSGWTLFCHRDLPREIAYNMAAAIDLCHQRIPVDHFDKRAMTMEEFSKGGEGGPLTIPLHPGAKRFYREKGLGVS